jgi:type VI secretion system protein ImpM
MVRAMSAWGDRGLFGKVPSRGDFVRAGLPALFVHKWDDWLQQVMTGSRERMGEDWLPAYLESPVWRFALPAGQCGDRAVIGLFLPSVDRVGRYFPLTLAAVLPPGAGLPSPENAASWLDECEALGRAALDDDVSPEALTVGLPPIAGGTGHGLDGTWWTEGGPRVAAICFTLSTLPTPAQFAAMLGANAIEREDA